MYGNYSLKLRSTCSIRLRRELFLHFTADLLHYLNQIESGDLLHIIIRKPTFVQLSKILPPHPFLQTLCHNIIILILYTTKGGEPGNKTSSTAFYCGFNEEKDFKINFVSVKRAAGIVCS